VPGGTEKKKIWVARKVCDEGGGQGLQPGSSEREGRKAYGRPQTQKKKKKQESSTSKKT